MSLNEIIAAEAAKLSILIALVAEDSLTSNEQLLQAYIDAVSGQPVSRGFVQDRMRDLEEVGAVRINEAGEMLIATITKSGVEHVEGRKLITGVQRPQAQ